VQPLDGLAGLGLGLPTKSGPLQSDVLEAFGHVFNDAQEAVFRHILDTKSSIRKTFIHTNNMPVHPSEEEAPMGITERIAKDPSSTTESTASDHEHHQNEHTPHQSAKASAQDFQSKGPQIPMFMNGAYFSLRSRWDCLAESPRRHATSGG